MEVAGIWWLVAQHTLLPQKQLRYGGPAECFSGTEVCKFQGNVLLGRAAWNSEIQDALHVKSVHCNSLGSKTQPEQTW